MMSRKEADITSKSEKTKTFSEYSVLSCRNVLFLRAIFNVFFLYSLTEIALTGGGQANSTESH